MLSRAAFISYLRSAVLVGAFVAGTAIVHAQTISTVAGNGASAYSGDGGLAILAALNRPRGVAFDASGNMYIADEMNHRIRRVTPGGTITTFAGTGTGGFSGDGGQAGHAQLFQPEDVFVDGSGAVYIADSSNHRVRKVTPGGIISSVAGTGTFGFNGDNIAAGSAQLNRPTSIAVAASGDLYIADSSNHRVRKVAATNGVITTVAGNGVPGYSGNVGPATSAMLRFPVGVALDSAGNLFIADAGNHVLRKVTPSNGFIFTVAGNGAGAGTDQGSFSGDGGLATTAGLNTPEDIAVDPAGNLYIADTANNRIRKMSASNNVITTIAGTGTDGFSGDGGPAVGAMLSFPWAVALDNSENVLVGDRVNNRIRKITLGSGTPGSPTVSASGTVNGASFAPGSNPMAPGTISAIFGTSLNNGSTASASGFESDGRLGTTLGGASVTLNGFSAPLFFSSSGQLNVQLPMELAGATSASVVVTVGGQRSTPRTVSLGPASPGIFTIPSGGTGQGAITIANTAIFAAPTGSISGARPAIRGVEFITIYCTGLGAVTNSPVTGRPAPSNPPATTIATPQVTIGGIVANVTFSGLTPRFVGLYQVNVQVPAASPTGDAIPLLLTIGGQQSNQVTIAVQ